MGEHEDFDATTDKGDVFRKRLPKLPAEASDRARELAEKYTRISFILVPDGEHELGYLPDATVAWFVVGVQSFRITPHYCDNRDSASWHCWMLAKALAKVLDAEKQTGGE